MARVVLATSLMQNRRDPTVDGKGLNHRFRVSGKEQTVKYRSRESCAVQISKEVKLQRTSAVTFAQPTDPCQSLFAKFFVTFQRSADKRKLKEPSDINANVVLDVREKTLAAKTDANIFQKLDPVTLEPLEASTYASLGSGLDGPLSAAHGATIDGTTYNYVLDLGPRPILPSSAIRGTGKAAPKYLQPSREPLQHISTPLLLLQSMSFSRSGKLILKMQESISFGRGSWLKEYRIGTRSGRRSTTSFNGLQEG